MPTPCSACGGRCGADSAECVYAGSGPAVKGVMPIKPACVMLVPTQGAQQRPEASGEPATT